MELKGVKSYPLLELGLSQIYLNADKIRAIEKWFNPNDMSNFNPVEVHNFGNGKYTITDGHSRAYIAYKNGILNVPIIYDNDDLVVGEMGQKLYCADIEWCNRFQINYISDLKNRILTNEEYQRLWVRRCDRSYNLLSQTSEKERELMQSKVPELFLYGAKEEFSEIYFENSLGELFVYKNEILYSE